MVEANDGDVLIDKCKQNTVRGKNECGEHCRDELDRAMTFHLGHRRVFIPRMLPERLRYTRIPYC